MSSGQYTGRSAFTLVELLIALVIGSLLVGMTASVYSLFRKAMEQDVGRAAASQNNRIALDRLSRELRQAAALVTALPANPSDTSVVQPSEIEFEDGHANDVTYRRYYLQGTTLQVETKEYYFPENPSVRVRWNTVNLAGETPTAATIGTVQDVADGVQSFSVYGGQGEGIQIRILTTYGSNGQTYILQTTLEGRNI